MEVAAAWCGLIAMAPIFALVALAIKATSPGPVFLRQERIGEHGRRVPLWKFRTMSASHGTAPVAHNDTQADSARSRREAPQLTSVGALLQRLSLDEIPQLYSVARGDLTWLGPRPPAFSSAAVPAGRTQHLHNKPGLIHLQPRT